MSPLSQRRLTLMRIAARYCPDNAVLHQELCRELTAAMNELQRATLDEVQKSLNEIKEKWQ